MTRDECDHGQLRRSCEICELRAELNGRNREVEEQSRLIEKQVGEIARLRQRIESAPAGQSLGMVVYYDDERASYKLEGRRVRLIVDEG